MPLHSSEPDEHNENLQEAGSNADAITQAIYDLVERPFSSDAENNSWDNGVENPSDRDWKCTLCLLQHASGSSLWATCFFM